MAREILLQADQRDRTAQDVLADGVRHSQSHEGQPLGEYATQLVKGYANHVVRVDHLIGCCRSRLGLDLRRGRIREPWTAFPASLVR
jgi:hypothetical protein